MMNDMPYGFTSNTWPGLAKLVEECGEVLELLGKIMGAGGSLDHRWFCPECGGVPLTPDEFGLFTADACERCDGKGYLGSGDLTIALHDELADLLAAAGFFCEVNSGIDPEYVSRRMLDKQATFRRWREEGMF